MPKYKFSEIMGIEPEELLLLTEETKDQILTDAPLLGRMLADELDEVKKTIQTRRLH